MTIFSCFRVSPASERGLSQMSSFGVSLRLLKTCGELFVPSRCPIAATVAHEAISRPKEGFLDMLPAADQASSLGLRSVFMRTSSRCSTFTFGTYPSSLALDVEG